MAAETVTAAEVLPIAGSTIIEKGERNFGATVTAGQWVYLDTATNTYKLADSDASATLAETYGVAMVGGSAGQPAVIAKGGSIDPGFTVAVGQVYILSDTAGGIAAVTDLTSGFFTSVLGVGITASELKIVITNSGVEVPA